jgi:hypothetical protein
LEDKDDERKKNSLIVSFYILKIQFLCILFQIVFRIKWSNFGQQVIDVVCGFNEVDDFFKVK